DNPRREHTPVARSEVSGSSEHFAQRGKTREYLRAPVQRIALKRVVVAPQCPNKQRVVLVERVVDARHIIGAAKLRWWIPLETRRVQTVPGNVRVWGRIAPKELGDPWVHTQLFGIVGGKVEALNAVEVRGAGAVPNSGCECAGAWVYQVGPVPGDYLPVNRERICRIRHEVPVDARPGRGCVDYGQAKGLVNWLR